jgi:hypothetical protein
MKTFLGVVDVPISKLLPETKSYPFVPKKNIDCEISAGNKFCLGVNADVYKALLDTCTCEISPSKNDEYV